MRTANTEPKDLLVAGVMDLAFVIAALLSVGGAPSKNVSFSAGSVRPAAAAMASTAPGGTSPVEVIAESRRPDLRPH